jgi:serine phosphatase RsbU (regulator of sigma subunit)
MPPASPSSHDTVARTNEYEVTTVVRGPFLVARCRGRYTDALLDVMQKQIFMQMRPMAIDAGALSGVTMPFARAAYYTAQALKSQGHALVLINPPDSVRGFIKLLGAEGRIPILLSESQLPAKVADVAQAAEKMDKELQLIRRELDSNQLWQFVDREYCWLCPFCGELREDVRLASRVSISQQALEKVWRHLNFDCRSYIPSAPRYKLKAELEAKVRDANQMKLNASAGRMEALQTKVAKLEEKQEWATNLEKGVKIAASRQRKLLPTRAPTVEGCEVSYLYRSADEVSGDLYDFVEMSEGRLGFVIGDVSGHGIEAGILMGMTKKVLSIRLSEMGDPIAAMKQTNADIVKDMDRSSFVTVAVLVWDPAARTLSSARAGHNPPLLFSTTQAGKVHRFENGGLMIGMAPPTIFDSQLVPEVVPVQPGDILLMYTDGLEEGKSPSGEEFGVGRLSRVIQAESGKPGSYILGALFYEFDRFAAGVEQEDDLTAICVKFK